jgi:hypothetical protein
MARSRSRNSTAKSDRRESNKGNENQTEPETDKPNYLTIFKNQIRNEFF